MKKYTGFTLIELMGSILILTIMLSVGIPQLSSFLDKKQFKVIEPTLEKSLRLARSEARKGSSSIRMLPLVDGNDWSKGWKIERVISADETELIQEFSDLPGEHSFTSEQYSTDDPLVILPNGQVQTAGQFLLNPKGCPGNKRYIYNVLLSGHLSKQLSECSE